MGAGTWDRADQTQPPGETRHHVRRRPRRRTRRRRGAGAVALKRRSLPGGRAHEAIRRGIEDERELRLVAQTRGSGTRGPAGIDALDIEQLPRGLSAAHRVFPGLGKCDGRLTHEESLAKCKNFSFAGVSTATYGACGALVFLTLKEYHHDPSESSTRGRH